MQSVEFQLDRNTARAKIRFKPNEQTLKKQREAAEKTQNRGIVQEENKTNEMNNTQQQETVNEAAGNQPATVEPYSVHLSLNFFRS